MNKTFLNRQSRLARLMELKRRANRFLKAEEEEIEEAEEVKPVEEQPEEVKEEVKETSKKVLDDGSEIDKDVDLSEINKDELVKITRADGVVLYMQAQDEEIAEEIYNSICNATVADEEEETETDEEEKPEADEGEKTEAEEISEDVLAEIPEDAEAMAVEVKEASLRAPAKLYYVIRSSKGIKAIKASKILSKFLMKRVASRKINPITAIKVVAHLRNRKMARKARPAVSNRMARKLAFRKRMAERMALRRKKAATAEIEDNLKLKEVKKPVNKWDLDFSEVKKNKYDSEVALEKKDFSKADDVDVKANPSDVRSYYGKLPAKAETGTDVEFGLKDFNQKRKNASVLKTIAQNLKTARTQLKEKDSAIAKKDSAIAEKDAEIKNLKAQLRKIAEKENLKKRSALIDNLIVAMHCEDEEEIRAMKNKFASYSDEQLNAVHETLTRTATDVAIEHEEDTLMSNLKKEAGELSGFTPSMTLKDEAVNSFDAIEKEILEKEQQSLN